MRVLFVTYCFGDWAGQTLIGVYKRGLRVAMELADRGHDIAFYCTGREAYCDELTALAEQRMQFVDFDFSVAAFDAADDNRRRFLSQMSASDLDVVVIGEVPMAGALLEATLCAVELGIPVVFLDNAYNGFSTERFIRLHGPMADGIILTGASSQFMAKPPPHLCQVAPFVDTSTSRADDFLRTELGLDGHHLITVLAYDNKVERIGVSLLERLEGREAEWLFVSRQPEVCCERIGVYLDRGKRARVISQPPDSVLFGLIGFSKLAIVKYGFMQVTECLSLRTPVIVGYHEGPTWLNLLPESSRGFAHVTSADFADDATLDAAQRFLGLPPDAMDAIHDGRFAAAAQAADFIEQLPRTPRSDTTAECLEQGFTRQALVAALRSAFPDHSVALGALRSMLLRERPDHDTFALLCDCLVDDQQRAVRLWGHRYASEGGLVQEAQAAAEQGRKVLHVSAADRVLIEADVGQAMLPPI